MRRPWRFTAILAAVVLMALATWAVVSVRTDRRGGDEVRATLSAVGALAGADTAGYARADVPRELEFPDDHGPHPRFRTEWWYLTGNLAGPDEGRFAYQITFFRNALSPEPIDRRSPWSTNQLWMAHMALTHVEGGRHRTAERFARGAVNLAGAESLPFRVWLDGWTLEEAQPAEVTDRGEAGLRTPSGAAPDAIFPLRLRAEEGDWGLNLVLDAGKPLVLQGERGLSRKGPEPGNASYYFSFTRLPTRGHVVIDGTSVPVSGDSWMDREWSTSALGAEHVGWDWFSIQLSDGRELMFFELRRSDGERDPFNHGVIVDRQGGSRTLSAADVLVEPTGRWISPLDGAAYPSGWTLEIPDEGLHLELEPVLADQEMNLSVRYWEGAVRVRGGGPDGSLGGWGFVELTGYGDRGDAAGAGGRGERR